MSHRYDRKIPLSFGFVASVLLHVALVWLLATNPVLFPSSVGAAPPRLVEIAEPRFGPPPEVEFPGPVAPIVRPATPEPTEMRVLPPSSPPTLEPPELIPHDVAPRLLNGADVLTALEEGYPDELPDDAARSHVLLWLFVDTGGNVTDTRVEASSGFAALDTLATRVAPSMAYSPARYQGDRVAVWIAQRIRFQPRREPPAGGPAPR